MCAYPTCESLSRLWIPQLQKAVDAGFEAVRRIKAEPHGECAVADQKFASDVLKVDSTPTFFINGEKIKGETSFEEFDKRIKALLKS